ncbi:DUF3575 domain-containing protein [Maribacter sp. HTCC2170]|uniref:DUF3575 domain-containing protein n=1 Tax=Maribacter sp. (strain HTCC2170 / KCCM 42371) TaxID=313603 RepID=UPI00006B3AFA|nr:DUF3575 domain-containing protein [Maribacter sp. HTCC2170]EAQ99747.1 hypothetical protein FB2170_07324 [Maribacter sp. HTCC2170]
MKNYLAFALIFVLFSFTINAQEIKEDDFDKHELKINASNLIAFQFLDFSYETLLNEESSLGLGVLVNVGDDNFLDEYRTFSLTPYYRQYFSRKYAKGFFVEGFGMLNSGKEEYYVYDEINGVDYINDDKYTDFALGISVGGKFVTNRGFVAEIYGGIGRNLIGANQYFSEIVGRGGISIGYRF